jgi:hypothetical protein
VGFHSQTQFQTEIFTSSSKCFIFFFYSTFHQKMIPKLFASLFYILLMALFVIAIISLNEVDAQGWRHRGGYGGYRGGYGRGYGGSVLKKFCSD